MESRGFRSPSVGIRPVSARVTAWLRHPHSDGGARNATTVLVVSMSQPARTRSLAAVLSIAATFWPRNRARIGSGAAMTRLKTCS